MPDTEFVTPSVAVPDSALGLERVDLIFQIGDFKVFVNWDIVPVYDPFDWQDEPQWKFSLTVGNFHTESDWNDGQPSAKQAQEFLYESLLKGIFEEKTLQVICP
jgi:hypothetical protein